jgi:hypothetical protein
MAPHILNLDTRWRFSRSRTTERCLSSGKFNKDVFTCYSGLRQAYKEEGTIEEWSLFRLISLLIFMKFGV